ncbi:MAG: hypothetical protein HY319_04980 [Armatimonadetes bacterium]|nr:hypothetical protein [Armatimonadota bacterium]
MDELDEFGYAMSDGQTPTLEIVKQRVDEAANEHNTKSRLSIEGFSLAYVAGILSEASGASGWVRRGS